MVTEVQELKAKIARLEFENKFFKDDFLRNILGEHPYFQLYHKLMDWYDNSNQETFFVVYEKGGISQFKEPTEADIESKRERCSIVVRCSSTESGTKYFDAGYWC